MMRKVALSLTLTAVISLLTLPASVEAQTRIRDLHGSSSPTISGRVINIMGNSFTLEDGTGQIVVNAGPRWWREVKVSVGEQLTISGEFEQGEFDAFSITRADGDVINVRSAEGPPPWEGGRAREFR